MHPDNENQFLKLSTSRLMRSETEIVQFEEALENIFKQQNVNHISKLFTGFDDNTEHLEVMYSLMHAIEAYYKLASHKIVLKEIINSIPQLIPHASGWAKRIIISHLNDNTAIKNLREVIKETKDATRKVVTNLLQEIEQEDSEAFGSRVRNVLEN